MSALRSPSTGGYNPPHLLTSLLPSSAFPHSGQLLSSSSLHAAAHNTPQSPDEEFGAGSGLGAGSGGGGGAFGGSGTRTRTGSRRGSGMRRRRSSRSVAMVAASLGEDELSEDLLPPERQRVLHDIRELFAGRPTVEIWERSFRRDSTYEDPLARAVGLRQVAAQFYALPLLFPPYPLASHLLASTPTQLVFSQTQLYTLRGTSIRKRVDSVVVVDLDPADRVKGMWDLWEGEEAPVRWGVGMLRRISGFTLPWVVRVPKEVLRIT